METAKELIDCILEKCADGDHLFRGTTQVYSNKEDGINSSLYRWAKDENVMFHENYKPVDIEKEMVKKAQRFFSPNASNIEILTDLRHYDGKVNLIDFSHNLYVALFFACNGHFNKNGELVFFNTANYQPIKKDIDYNNREVKVSIVRPANTQTSQRRTISQSSVFLFTQDGYIQKDHHDIFTWKIEKEFKQGILEFLKQFHNISIDTIYNDIIGFITNEKNYETGAVHFYRGLAKYTSGKYEEAIEDYNKSIEINPQIPVAYNNRGLAKEALGKYKEALDDYNKAIEIDPQYAVAHNNRGNAKQALEKYKEALDDYNKAIEIDPQYGNAYYNRGHAKQALEKYKEALDDYNKAIEIDPQDAVAHNNRGNAKQALEKYKEALDDYNKAIEIDPQNGNAYYNRGITKLKLGNREEGIEDYNKAIELDPALAKKQHPDPHLRIRP